MAMLSGSRGRREAGGAWRTRAWRPGVSFRAEGDPLLSVFAAARFSWTVLRDLAATRNPARRGGFQQEGPRDGRLFGQFERVGPAVQGMLGHRRFHSAPKETRCLATACGAVSLGFLGRGRGSRPRAFTKHWAGPPRPGSGQPMRLPVFWAQQKGKRR